MVQKTLRVRISSLPCNYNGSVVLSGGGARLENEWSLYFASSSLVTALSNCPYDVVVACKFPKLLARVRVPVRTEKARLV